jgi:tellurite resistance protein
MTPGEKNILRSLVAVAWADGQLESGESSVIEGLLTGFDASEAEEQEILEYARTRRTLEADVPVAALSGEDRELLLANAALLTHADGEQSDAETEVLGRVISILGFTDAEAHAILAEADDGALALGARSLEPDPD